MFVLYSVCLAEYRTCNMLSPVIYVLFKQRKDEHDCRMNKKKIYRTINKELIFMEYTHGVYVWCMCEDCEPWSRDRRHSDHRAPSCMICSYTRLHTRKMPDDPKLLLFLFCQLFSHLATTASNIAARCATNKYGITSQFIYDNNISFSTLTGLREHISQQSISCTRSGGGRSA